MELKLDNFAFSLVCSLVAVAAGILIGEFSGCSSLDNVIRGQHIFSFLVKPVKS